MDCVFGMVERHDNSWALAAASALEWWEAVGADCLVEDTVCDWFATPPPRSPDAVATPRTEPPDVLPTEALPQTLDAFLVWRFGEGAPERRWNMAPIPIEGDPASALLVIVDQPDSEHGLCDGASGRLLDAMLAAINCSRAEICLAAIAHARPLAGRLRDDEMAQLARLARHFAKLSGASRILLLSKQASGAFLETSDTHPPRLLHGINQGSGEPEIVATLHPRFLLERPAHKATAWKDLQLLFRGKRQ